MELKPKELLEMEYNPISINHTSNGIETSDKIHTPLLLFQPFHIFLLNSELKLKIIEF